MLESKGMNKWAQTGFTVIESLIFVTIAGALLTSTVAILYNRQRTIEFNQSVRQFELEVNDLINDIATGNFPVVNGVACQQNIGTNELIFVEDTEATPGSNRDCIFMGKVIQFGLETNQPPTPDDSYGIHTLLGSSALQQGSYKGSPYIATLFNNALPPAPNFDTFESVTLGWSSAIADAYYIDDEDTPLNASDDTIYYVTGIVLAYAEFGEHFDSGGEFFGKFRSGSSRVSVFAIRSGDSVKYQPTPTVRSTTLDRLDQAGFRDFITGDPDDVTYEAPAQMVNPESDVVVCLINLISGRKAALEIGTEQGGLRARANFDIESTECIYDD